MKRALKILVPLLFAAAIVLSIGWYFLEYDPDFTRDLLLQQARRLEENGNLTAAVWFYDLAYQQSRNNDQVAIELAEQFKNIGNYTKAEYTLSKAIEDGGTVELYTALCKTYVEQNKLLDAAKMLDKISNPSLKEQLDALRPAAPVASIEPGRYSQYLTVSVSAESGTLYTTTDLEYPSLKEDVYTDPIVLGKGETTILAMAVGEDGLVSTPVKFTYVIDSVIEIVELKDKAVEAELRAMLQLPADQAIYSNDLWNIKEFTLPAGAVTLEDLKWMPYLEGLVIENNVIDSLSFLDGMQRLKTLVIKESVVPAKELSYIGNLPALTTLQMSGCGLSSIKGLETATGLEFLNLSDNTIRDISGLAGMTELTELNLRNNALVNLEDVVDLTKLTTLDVSYNSIVTTAPLANLPGLTFLAVNGNGLMQLEGIETLTNLETFLAAENKLVDIQVLAGCSQLKWLDVSNNTLLDINVISNFPLLEQLNFSYNEVTSLPGFAAGCPLTIIDGSHNQLSNLDALAGLSFLEYVFMDYNAGISSVYPLANCPALKLVNVYNTAVTSVHILTDRGVAVNYKPL